VAEIGSCGALTEPVALELERPEPEVDYFGRLVGTVTDSETGDPIEGAGVSGGHGDFRFETVTDADGNWEAEVFIGTDPADVWGSSITLVKHATHWPSYEPASVPVDAEVRVDAQLVEKKYVTLIGTITDSENGDPVEAAYVATSKTGTGSGGAVVDFSEADGSYSLPELLLAEGVDGGGFFPEVPPNGPRTAYVSATFGYFGGPDPDPYWPVSVETTLLPDGPNVLDLQMVPVCESASVSGLVVNAATLEPLEGVDIYAGGGHDLTNAEGRYAISGIKPGTNNAPRDVTVRASKEGFFDATIDITTFCGAELLVDFGTPSGGFGTVVGTVTNSDTSDPIADVFIGTNWGDSTTTAADGTYSFDRAPLTSDGEPRDWTITARRGQDQLEQIVTVSADVEARADFVFGTVNLPPTATSQALTTDTETPIPITLTGNDPEGVPLTFTLVDPPALGTLGGTAPALTYTPTGTAGDDALTFTVGDGEHTSALATITIDVVAVVNAPPVIAAPATVEVPAGSSRDIGVTANDPDDDDLDFSLVSDGEGLAALDDHGDDTATITVDTEVSDAGRSVEVEVAVTDGEESDAATITVKIVAPKQTVNRPPDIVIAEVQPSDEGTKVEFDATATTDPDGDALTFEWALLGFDLQPIATGSGPKWSYQFDDDFVGAAQVVVTDARGESATAEVEVLVNNVAPVLDRSLTQRGGARFDLSGRFTDAGAGDTHVLSVDWGDGTTDSLSHEGGFFEATHTYGAMGTYDVVIEVCDDDTGCALAGENATVDDADSTPVAPSDAPVLTIPPTGGNDGAQILLALVFLLLGAALLATSRRRRPTH